MRGRLFAAAATATLVAATGIAVAASGNVIWYSGNSGPVAYAEASWETRTATSITDAGVLAAQTHRDAPGSTGPAHGAATHVFFEVRTIYLDAEGRPTGGVDVSGNANGDVPFTIDDRTLASASLDATVPVTTCALDATGTPSSCTDGGTTRITVSWTGQGTLTRGSAYEDHFLVPGGFVFVDRLSGTFRLAGAGATIGGQVFDTASELGADMGNSVQLTVLMCPHGC